MRIAVALVSLTGCDYFINLDPRIDATPESLCPALDEDADCIDNATDNCPGIANDQIDNDGDGIGDACDPNPTLGGDRRLRFDSFDDPNDAANWIDHSLNGKWMLAPGEFRHPDTGDNFAQLESTTPSTANILSIEAGFTFAAWTTAFTTNVRIGIVIDHEANTSPGHSCWFAPMLGMTEPRANMQEHAPGSPIGGGTTSQPIPTLVTGDRMRLLFTRDSTAQRLACRAQVAAEPEKTLEPVPASATWPTARYFAITAANAGVTLDYVILYDRP